MYTPPPRPDDGLASSLLDLRTRLRPMGVGDIIDESIRLYQRNFTLFVATVAVLEVPYQIIVFVLTVTLLGSVQSTTVFNTTVTGNSTFSSDQLNRAAGVVGAAIGVGLLVALVAVLIFAVMTAALAVVISQRFLDRPITVGAAYRLGTNRLGSILLALLWALVRLILMLIGLSILVGIVVAVVSAIHLAWLAVLLGIVGGVFLVCLPTYFSISWLLIPQAIVLDGVSALGASARSRLLVRGYWWKTLGLLLLTSLLVMILGLIPSAIIQAIVALSGSSLVERTVISSIVSLIVGVLTRPLQFSALTLLFYDLKIRKEAFDLEAMIADSQRSPGFIRQG